jgi:tetratricopeptide (TPR) repeat protein
VTLNCRTGHDKPPVVLNPAQNERVTRLLQSLHDRAESDRAKLPQFEAEAAAAKSGNPSVLLGELYYGFGDYGKAIEWIRRGLGKGGAAHLEDAYVYLGLSEQAEGNMDEARKAFAQLSVATNR